MNSYRHVPDESKPHLADGQVDPGKKVGHIASGVIGAKGGKGGKPRVTDGKTYPVTTRHKDD